VGENLAAAAEDDSDPTVVSPVLLLTRALDETDQASDLVRLCHNGLTHRRHGSSRRKSWLPLALGGNRTADHVSAGLAVQYFGENLDRARDRWRQGVEHYEQLFAYHGHREPVSQLHNELTLAGLFTVLDDLQQQAVPAGRKPSATHLVGVLRRIRACNAAGIQARTQMILRQEKTEQR
jgi:hypothetical protein